MSWELILWIVSFFVAIGLLASNLYQLICLSDLEADHINPYDSASRINAIVVFEFLAQGMICALFLLTWHWFMFLLSAPVAYYHIRLYLRRKHLIDVTEIFSLLNAEKNLRFVKLGFYLVQFFIVIFSSVYVLLVVLVGDLTAMMLISLSWFRRKRVNLPYWQILVDLLVMVAVMAIIDEEDELRDGIF